MTTEGTSIDQLKNMIKLQGLDTSGGGGKNTPIDEVIGDLESWEPFIQKARTAGQRDRTMVRLTLTDIEVVRSSTPYTAPNAQIEIAHSNQGIRPDGQGSMWGWWAKSCEPVLADGAGMDYLTGHRLQISWQNSLIIAGKRIPTKLYDGRANEGAGGAVQRETWVLVGFDGQDLDNRDGGGGSNTSSGGGDEEILAAVDGKSRVEAGQALLAIETVRNTRMNEVVNGAIYDKLIEAGKLKEENGVLSRA